MMKMLPLQPWGLGAMLLILLFSCTAVETVDYEELGVKVRNILALPSYEMVYKDISYVGRQQILLGFIPAKDKRLLFSVQIRVRAGIDLASGGVALEPIPDPTAPDDPGRRGIRVRLPPAHILLVDADDKSLSEYFVYERGDKITRADWEDQIKLARVRIEADAIERGILVKAWDNGAKLVRNFLTVAGFSHVECVRTSPVTPAEVPSP